MQLIDELPSDDGVTPDKAVAVDWLGLTGSRVLVVGAGGIGTECAKGYVAAGARVVVADRDQARLDALEADPTFAGSTICVDLTQTGAGATTVAGAIEILGGLDVLLHCV